MHLNCEWVASKMRMGSEQDARTTTARISPLLTLWFKCRTAYIALRAGLFTPSEMYPLSGGF